MRHAASIAAYPTKDGKFSAAFLNKATGEVVREPGFDTLEAARYRAKAMAWDAIGECVYAPLRRRGEYQANVWVG